MVPTHLLEVTLLGRFAVVVGGREIPARAWGSRKAQQLVKLLALAPRHRLTTEQILDAFGRIAIPAKSTPPSGRPATWCAAPSTTPTSWSCGPGY